MKFKLFTAWYDGWWGYYYDRKRRVLYIGFPMWVMWSFASDQCLWNQKQKKWVLPEAEG